MNYSNRFAAAARGLWLLPLLALGACSGHKDPPPAPPPPEVTVIKATAGPVTLYEEYAAQTEAVDTVEIRARVGGILERQAFADGARVKKGELLFVIDRQPYLAALAQARANLAQAEANHVNSRQNLTRIKPLLADQAVSQQDVDTAVAKEGADAASVAAARAQVEQAQLNLGYTAIRAPRDGVISKALVKPGGLVDASTTLLTTLYSSDPIYCNFAISEEKLLTLQRELKANPGEALAHVPPFRIRLVDGSDYQYPGRLNFVDAAVDPKNGTLQVRVAVPNPQHFLKPGEFVRVVMPGRRYDQAIRLPQQAVQEMQGKRSALVVGPDNKVVYRELDAPSRIGNDWLVAGGLKPGELVIVEGAQKARPGSAVKPVLAQAVGPREGHG